MVIWTKFRVVIHGAEKVRKAVQEYIEMDEANHLWAPALKDVSAVTEGDTLKITGLGRWHGPITSFIQIATIYGVEAEISDIEGRGGEFHLVNVSSEGKVSHKKYSYASKERFDFEGLGLSDVILEFSDIFREHYWSKNTPWLVKLLEQYGISPDQVFNLQYQLDNVGDI